MDDSSSYLASGLRLILHHALCRNITGPEHEAWQGQGPQSGEWGIRTPRDGSVLFSCDSAWIFCTTICSVSCIDNADDFLWEFPI